MESENYYKKKSMFENGVSKKKRINKKSVFFNMTYLMISFIICFIGGIILGILTTSYTPEISIMENDDNIFKFILKDNKIIIGGKLNINLNIKNNTLLSYALHAKNVKYFYYPVGANPRCFLYNGGVEDASSNQLPLQHKSEIAIPLNQNENGITTEIFMKVKYRLLKPFTYIYKIPLHLGYIILDSHKKEIQSLYNDCKRFNILYFSVLFDELYISNKIKKINNDKRYELIFSCKCFVDANVDNFFNSSPVNKNIILENLNNDPNLVDDLNNSNLE
ncbi:conserved Plasmodium protein, unknown function [Plasmodium berghei]|uniref:Uncharacterized protein n=2 Tax=Plasmodium berghei TaxID=5821 RepID=A0A509ATH4_PLABA|nr:conserved protein, unknown function [Plasmodium berghei ANKA]CXI72911.1 conserved Plasmodium protein, unknown function [Plasmodium berghei]SCM24470.1 conserved Plasmodium protein, unknown function [Plasmodium berghei]SCN27073.1 conserved Plasmodium protein, unknown function [Plasmodium berghei]SCO63495.1 conserved Plasmodium protein, unknown function [Plasmodium berghei]VUC56928.1 conserved protein, unknown function [Plasmodium berghei ANKA]|eukprot:XP_034422707.1 conserved protein, unknown function [Plasmodium berghei ANKA]